MRYPPREVSNTLRWLARDYERLPTVLVSLHILVFACLILHQMIHLYSRL